MFDGKFYKQLQDIAMHMHGTKFAPAYANNFMDKLEWKILSHVP